MCNLALNAQVSGLAVCASLRQVAGLARARGHSDLSGLSVDLTNGKKLSPARSTPPLRRCAFSTKVTLEPDWTPEEVVPLPKKPQKAADPPIILSPEELHRFLGCVLEIKHHAILTTCYAAGLRISEAVQPKPSDIDSQRRSSTSSRAKARRTAT